MPTLGMYSRVSSLDGLGLGSASTICFTVFALEVGVDVRVRSLVGWIAGEDGSGIRSSSVEVAMSLFSPVEDSDGVVEGSVHELDGSLEGFSGSICVCVLV